ncbi:DinB family protein [Isoptericola sp. b441]|uniref:DinB family protein n=1 Tax=Actinotalea lenta TaxID=3064654 RepID=A0ABT9D811_9CELL|nr:DinB family protein [Isoptericola sp. b441]MDO8107009.1 DinB family protein [Isoptericola sp. b441]
MDASLVDEHGRNEPPTTGDEEATLLGFLDYQRATLEWKTRNLDHDGLSATLHPTTMTLGGLLKHLAWVEDWWFSQILHDNAPAAAWDDVDWRVDPDWEWHSAAQDSPEQLRGLWQAAVLRSRDLTERALEQGGMDRLSSCVFDDGHAPSLRWIVVHMIEEYARHNGHADLLREAFDGETGE